MRFTFPREGVDLAVVAQVAEGLGALPGGGGVVEKRLWNTACGAAKSAAARSGLSPVRRSLITNALYATMENDQLAK